MIGHKRVRVTTITVGLCALSWLAPGAPAWADPQKPTVSSPKPPDSSDSHSLIQRPRKKPATKSPAPHQADVNTKTRAAESKPRSASASTAAPTQPEVHTAADRTASLSTGVSSPSSVIPIPPVRNSLGSAAASITSPLVPLATRENNRSTTASAAAANSGSPTGGSPSSRGFNNLLARFPQLGQAINTPAASAPAIPTAPVPTITAPVPQNPESPSSGTSRNSMFSAPPALGSATLSWSPNAEADLGGYKIYLGTRSGIYDYPGSPFIVGNTTRTVINNLPHGHTYYFAATAYDLAGNESAHSAEVSKSLY